MGFFGGKGIFLQDPYFGKPIIKIPQNIFVDDLSENQSWRLAPLQGIQAELEEKKTRTRLPYF